ncbi:MAG: bile acid:sodium symporter [Proteobacteria bacterium]|nr:bile acid:sodium symporter [Pseudomonadota bacterium]
MVRLLLAAMLVASLAPVHGAGRAVARGASDGAVFVLFLLYGLKLSREEVLAGLSNRKLLGPLVLWVFGAMAVAGWLAWRIEAPWLGEGMALGFLFLGVLPSTVQAATAYSSLAGGNVAASVVAAALLNLSGVVLTPALFALLGGAGASGGESGTLVKVLTTLLLPFALGQLLQGAAGAWVRAHRPVVTMVERGSIAIAVYVAFSGAVLQGVWHLLGPAGWAALGAGCAVLLVLGYGGPWVLGGWLGLPRGERIAMLFAGAQKSLAMGAPLASVMFAPARAGLVLVPLIAYHLSQMLVAAPLAARLRAGTPLAD